MELKINDRLKVRTIKYFNEVQVESKYDSIASAFSFNFYFDPENHDHEELACVSHYHEAILEHDGQKILHGYIVKQDFKDSSIKEMASFSGYSLPGFLGDCNIPPEIYPLQFDGLTLKQIAQKLIKPFNLKMVIDPLVEDRMNIQYNKTSAEPTQAIADYLIDLAAQRNIIVSHDTQGRLLFTQLGTKGVPVLSVTEGLIGTEMTMSFNGQDIHSHITVMKQADSEGGNAGQYTIRNPFVPVARTYRPKTIIQNSGDNTSTKLAAQNALAAELKNIVLTISVDRWELNGVFIKPNSLISVKNKKLYIYKKTNFFVESVTYKGNSESQTAVLTCTLPACYDGTAPFNIFVDPHKNSATGFTSPV
jgi:prophage tail gpP-like protein